MTYSDKSLRKIRRTLNNSDLNVKRKILSEIFDFKKSVNYI